MGFRIDRSWNKLHSVHRRANPPQSPLKENYGNRLETCTLTGKETLVCNKARIYNKEYQFP